MSEEKLSYWWGSPNAIGVGATGCTFSLQNDLFDGESENPYWIRSSSASGKATCNDVMRAIDKLDRRICNDHAGQNEQLSRMQTRIKELATANEELRRGLKEALSLLSKNSLKSFWCKLFVGYALFSIALVIPFLFCPMKVSLLFLLIIMLISIAGFCIGREMRT